MYWLLFFVLCGMTIAIYFIFKKDILSPTFLFSFMFTISVLAAIIAQNYWNDVEIDAFVFFVPIVGVIGTFLGELFMRWIYKKKTLSSVRNNQAAENRISKISFSKVTIFFAYIFILITLLLLIREMSEITGVSNNIPEMINRYRNMTPLFNAESEGVSVSTFLVQLIRITDLLGMIALLVSVNNLIKGERVKTVSPYIGIVLFSSLAMLFVNGRTSLIQYAFFAFGITILLLRKQKAGKRVDRKQKRKTIIAAVAGSILVLVIFYLIMPMIGRSQIGGPIAYSTFYVGNPLPSLQKLKNENRLSRSSFFGEESLESIRGILKKVGFDIEYDVFQDTWVYFRVGGRVDQTLASNTFTGMKPYYADWGFVGIVACQILFGFMFTALYFLAKSHDSVFLYAIFGMFLMNVIAQVSLEKFFTRFSVATIFYLVYAFILSKVLFLKVHNKKLGLKDEK